MSYPTGYSPFLKQERNGTIPKTRAKSSAHVFAPLGCEELGFWGSVKSTIENALLDQHGSVRMIAQYYLQKDSKLNLAERYRALLDSSTLQQLPFAIAGLGETGDETDAQRLESYLDRDNADARVAALRALNRLAGVKYRSVFLFLMGDSQARVARWAARILRQYYLAEFAQDLWSYIADDLRPAVRLRALSLLDQISHWDAVIYLLRACSLPDPELVRYARWKVEKFWESGFVIPTSDQEKIINEVLAKSVGTFSQDQIDKIQSKLKRLRS